MVKAYVDSASPRTRGGFAPTARTQGATLLASLPPVSAPPEFPLREGSGRQNARILWRGSLAIWLLIRSWWRARQRKIDLEVLWLACVQGAADLDHARAAFADHIFSDPAWLELGEEALIRFVEHLQKV